MEIRWPYTSPVEPQGLPRWWNIPSAAMDWVLWPVEGIGTACLEGPNLRGVGEQREEVKEEEGNQRVSQEGLEGVTLRKTKLLGIFKIKLKYAMDTFYHFS